ncbi:DUF4229 domain-containing protein [Skermania sp. ID1734]|nr:DUF4229 domain-containing protein [Skermania sp. ID1734]
MSQAVGAGRRLARLLIVYTIFRLALVAALAAIILFGAKLFGVDVPLLVALIFGLVIAMPISLLLFRSLRRQVNENIALVDERRRQDKEKLRSRLRGDDGSAVGR